MQHFNSLSKFVMVLEYNGMHYSGFQWQKGKPTIQAALEDAIYKVTGEQRRVISASRTDAGVHARGQVASFRSRTDIPSETLIKALNYYLPRSIAIKAISKVNEEFNIQKDAISREYEYLILNSETRSPLLENLAYHVPHKLNLDIMNMACDVIKGEHDFASFASSASYVKNTVRNIYHAEFKSDGNLIKFRIIANSFLMHQVRNTVGLLLQIGKGKQDINELKRIITEKKHGLAGPAAPASGLYLIRINYPSELESKYENLFGKKG